ncbi:MAG: helix-turn-helix transcriptional regulator [Candidatus Hatepunaea meridiana]|nr:helix-turn-helix transcriptional regulator [Candidatus Hatepunaea meridiana]
MRYDKINYPQIIKDLREQLGLSQEYLARELGVSFATVNRWENGQAKPSKLAKVQFDKFCIKMTDQGRLTLPEDILNFLYICSKQQEGAMNNFSEKVSFIWIESEIADMLAEVTG